MSTPMRQVFVLSCAVAALTAACNETKPPQAEQPAQETSAAAQPSATSVCTGALVLAAAGLLDGMTATTHWRAQELFNSLGATYVAQRVVEHLPERIITAAGVSSGIDMALRLVELLVDREAAEARQLMIEYDPQPPFDAGNLGKASAEVRELADEYYRHRS